MYDSIFLLVARNKNVLHKKLNKKVCDVELFKL